MAGYLDLSTRMVILALPHSSLDLLAWYRGLIALAPRVAGRRR
jgi:hypothetical protein